MQKKIVTSLLSTYCLDVFLISLYFSDILNDVVLHKVGVSNQPIRQKP